MADLIAYIPVIHKGHEVWFSQHPNADLWVIPQEIAGNMMPCLSRDMRALHHSLIVKMINLVFQVSHIGIWNPSNIPTCEEFIMPDEEISHILAETVLIPLGRKVFFENVNLRWDMSAVKRQSPIITNITISNSSLDNLRMDIAKKMAPKSPDWWRQVGGVVFKGDEMLVCAYNRHLPTEYEVYIFGDPRMNFEAGQPGVYTSIHAEQAIIVDCAKKGISLEGASLYITTFPCLDCARWVALAGIKKLYFEEGYSTLNAQEVLKAYEVEIIQVRKNS